MAKKASEADSKPKQDPDSEAEKKVQDGGSEGGDGKVQEPKLTLEEAKEALLKDENFMTSVLESSVVKEHFQSERDTWGHEQTLPLKRQVEELEARLTVATKASDPDMKKYEQMKEEGDWEGALRLLESKQTVAQAESAAVQRGKREGSQEILAAIAQREEFSDLTQEDWQKITAAATAEAQAMGRSYITVDQYIAHTVRVVREKEKEMVGTADEKEREKQISDGIDAELKKRGIKSREEDGGSEDPAEGGGGGGAYTVEQIKNMSRAELAKVPKEERDKVMAGSGKEK